MRNPKKQKYRDGYIYILNEIIKKNEFNAKEKGKFYNIVVELPFNELSKRMQDKELFNKFDKQLDLKIEVPNCKMEIDNKYKVIINDDVSRVFDITYYDETHDKYYLYLTVIGGDEDVSLSRA